MSPGSFYAVEHPRLPNMQRRAAPKARLAAAASFTYQNTAVCFFGHTHVPVAFMRDSVVRGGTYSKFKVGAALLWVGWFGFNAGSAVAANGTAGMAMLVTQLATAAAR